MNNSNGVRKSIVSVFIAIVAVAVVVYLIAFRDSTPRELTPSTPNPQTHAEQLLAEKEDLIRVSSVIPYELVSLPFVIEGEARGNWYFEADFPVTVFDASGNVLLETYATAQGEWMTTDFVPFSVSISDLGGYTGPITVILQKDNPSDMRELDDEISIPLFINSF